MSRFFSGVFTSLCALSCFSMTANETSLVPPEMIHGETPSLQSTSFTPSTIAPVQLPSTQQVSTPATASTPAPKKVAEKPPQAPFRPFTGKVKGKKVRLRLNADLESPVIREMNKNDLLSVVGENGNFWVVEPPAGTKAYVFRSFVLDNVVEGNRVNVRLEPSLDAPVIGHLSSGEKVNGSISSVNNKWLEIKTPSSARFFVAKELLQSVGGPEVKAQIEKRKQAVANLLDTAALLTKAEMGKPFEEIDLDHITHQYKSIIADYSDFPEQTEQAKETMAALQETYLQKRIAFLEEKAKRPPLSEQQIAMGSGKGTLQQDLAVTSENITDKMKLWEPIEESLYLTWAQINDNKNMDEFYSEQALTGVRVSGILESYVSPVKNKPGDFIIKDKDLPVAYVYSTQLNLQKLVGKKVTLLGAPRPNNNFAFPAYVVLGVEN